MPIVFVHGVSNRDTPEYRDNQDARDAFLRKYVVPRLGMTASDVAISNPYWGDHGIRFRWGNISLPDTFDSIETFGAGLNPEEQRIAEEIIAPLGPAATNIVDIARHSLADAIDVVWTAALLAVQTPSQAEVLAESSRRAFDYAAAQPKPEWLATATSDNFIDLLLEQIEHFEETNALATAKGAVRWESFGAGSLFDQLEEGASRITGLLPQAMSRIATALSRKKAHMGASIFLGDIFQYLTERGERDDPGPIVSTVLNAFQSANSKRSDTDPKLMIIGHSLGGVVTYDILTYFQPDLEVDAFVTVGSQVALFEEMGLYKHPLQVGAPPKRLARPANIKQWLNVMDPNDVFSFRAEGVFEGVSDFVYETGFGLSQAHSGYFHRPSFYRRLGERLAEVTT